MKVRTLIQKLMEFDMGAEAWVVGPQDENAGQIMDVERGSGFGSRDAHLRIDLEPTASKAEQPPTP